MDKTRFIKKLMIKNRIIKKRIFSVVLSLALLCSLLSDRIRIFAEEEQVVYINSVEDLFSVAKSCRLDTYSQKKRFELTEDLNLATEMELFEGFATFGGTFYGNGHMISGIQAEYQGSNQGFFRYVQKDGKIENLNLVGSATFSGSSVNVGMLAGVNEGTIRGCSVTTSINGKNTIGGIAGVNEGTGVIEYCMVKGSISGEHYTGGIAGKNLGVISGCTNYASINTSVEEVKVTLDELNLEQLNAEETISTSTDTGGIAGFSSGSITDSTNRGRIGYPHVGYNIGGIVGRQSGYIENCDNYGTIHGRKDVAGIVGQMEPYLLLQYSEDTVQKLDGALGQLDRAMEQLLDDLDLSSDNLKGHLDQVLDLLDLVKADFKELSNQTVDYANEIVDSTNDITERMDLALSRTHGVFDIMQKASDNLTRALEEMENAAENVEDVSDDGRIVFASLQEAMEDLSRVGAHLSTAIQDVKNVQDILQKKLQKKPPITSEPEETASNQQTDAETTSRKENHNSESESVSKELESISLPNRDELESISKELESLSLPNREEWESISKELESVTVTKNDIRSLLLRYFTEEELKNLEANLSNMNDQLQYASNALRRAFGDIEDLRPYLKSMADSGDVVERHIEDALNFMEQVSLGLSDAFAEADTIMDALEGSHAVSFPKLDSGYQSLIDSIADLCGRVVEVLKSLNLNTDSNSNRITDDMRRINDCISNVEEILLDALKGQREEKEEEKTDENGTRIFQEATYEETKNILQGKLKGAVNYGTVEADIAVGGIAGNMAIEYDLDPEEDIHIQGEISLNFQYKSSTLLSDSVNYGTITAKKDHVGGIVGKMDLGTARNCQSYGNVSSESGKYIGGIAGSSGALIENAYVRCKLTGTQYIGGIAGSAYDLNHCYALIRIEEATEYYGAIAGEVAKNGKLYENYFVSGEWDGIDRVSYSEMAMPISYEEMVGIEGFPEEFTEFLLMFVADDIIVAEIPFHYGDSLSADRIPKVPEKEGYYANWEPFDYQNMEFNEVIEAVYTKELTVISSEAKAENGKMAVFLLEGIFDEKAAVTVHDIRESIEISLKEREKLLSGWHIEVYNPRKNRESYTAHVVKPAEENIIQLWKMQDGNWTEIEFTESGSYLVFEMDGEEVDICLTGVSSEQGMILGVLGGILGVGGIAFLIRRRKKKRGQI